MNRLFFLAVTLTFLTACASMRAQTMAVATTSATPGDGQTVAFKGDAGVKKLLLSYAPLAKA